MNDKEGRTEKPTPRRLREARRDGRIARSPEAGAWATVLLATLAIPHVVTAAGAAGRADLREVSDVAADPQAAALPAIFGHALGRGIVTIWPLAAVAVVTAIATGAAQGGIHFSPKALRPQAKRLNPLPGIKRMFGPHGLFETAKALLKSAAVGLFAYRSVSHATHVLLSGGRASLPATLSVTTGALVGLVRGVAAVALVLALVDAIVVRRRTQKSLRMTKQEIRDEARLTEGNPQLKAALRGRHIQLSRSRMMMAVANADVVLANPTHVAVALRYEAGRGAPRVVARGAGAVAARIRAKAEEHRIPIVVDVPLARAVYRAADVGQEIPAELYTAVARVLAFVMGLRRRGAHAGTHRNPHATHAA